MLKFCDKLAVLLLALSELQACKAATAAASPCPVEVLRKVKAVVLCDVKVLRAQLCARAV